MLKFKIDENLPEEIVDILIAKNYDAISVRNEKLSGEVDEKIASVCLKESRVLVTLDKDFSDIRTYPPDVYPGIIVLRLKYQDKYYILNLFSKLLEKFKVEELQHKLWIVEDTRLRIFGGE